MRYHANDPVPCLLGSTRVFDDAATGLKEEVFISGMLEMISRIVESKGIRNAERGFAMLLSDRAFAGADTNLMWVRENNSGEPLGGNWDRGEVAGQMIEGWLCPALFC